MMILKQINEKTLEKRGLYGFREGNDRVTREALWQVLRMYDVDCKLINGIKTMYINSL